MSRLIQDNVHKSSAIKVSAATGCLQLLEILDISWNLVSSMR